MKAAVFTRPGQPLAIEELPKPEPSDSEILVRIKACEVARSVVERVRGKSAMGMKTPIIMGSGGSGVVEGLGSGVEKFKVGDHVGIYAIQACENCHNCNFGRVDLCSNMRFMGYHFDGTFAEYVRIPENNAFRIPPSISFEEGAIFGSTFGTPYHALKKANLRQGDVLVICGLGALGLMALQIAKSWDAYVIGVDVMESKLRVAQDLGIDQALIMSEEVSEQIKSLTAAKQGADFVFIAVGNSKVMEQSIDFTRRGGRVIIIADCIEPIKVRPISLIMGVELTGSTYFLKSELEDMLRLITQKKVSLKPLINQTFSLDQVNQAISVLEEGGHLYRVITTM
jgi:D-arabinose 1-dehydrogenase-like Zn-dependent alcohol dehydrogenase